MGSEPWRPLLAGEVAARAWAVVEDIARALDPAPPNLDGDPRTIVTLMGREPGFALFHAYLDRALPGRGHLARAAALIDPILDGIPAASDRPAFAYGFTGAAWAVEHLRAVLPAFEEDPFTEVDDALGEIASRTPAIQHGLRFGLAGIAVYALERPAAGALLERVVDRLAERAERSADGVTWRCHRQSLSEHTHARWPDGRIAITAINGAPGPIAVLAAACARGVTRARPLLEAAWADVWCRRGEPDDGWASWGTGELGTAAVLAVAAGAVDEPAWQDQVMTALRGFAARPVDDALARADLSGGAIGVAHMFNRIYQRCGEAVFAEAAMRWYDRGLALRVPGEGLAGFSLHSPAWQRLYFPAYPIGKVGAPGLGNGIAGIGLALLAALTDEAPAWDRAFLLSLRASPWTA